MLVEGEVEARFVEMVQFHTRETPQAGAPHTEMSSQECSLRWSVAGSLALVLSETLFFEDLPWQGFHNLHGCLAAVGCQLEGPAFRIPHLGVGAWVHTQAEKQRVSFQALSRQRKSLGFVVVQSRTLVHLRGRIGLLESCHLQQRSSPPGYLADSQMFDSVEELCRKRAVPL